MTTCGGVLSEALLTGRSGWMRCSLRRTSPLLSSHPHDIHSHFKLFSFIHHTLNPLLSLELFLFFIYSSCYPLTHPSILARHALFFSFNLPVSFLPNILSYCLLFPFITFITYFLSFYFLSKGPYPFYLSTIPPFPTFQFLLLDQKHQKR